MGRGIQMLAPDSDPTDVKSYVLTEDLEVCDERSAHLAVRVPADDANPYCMVGGGQMNLEAGEVLLTTHNPLFVVCAYGDRSDYLKSVNGPTESEVMSELLRRHRRPSRKDGWMAGRPGCKEPEIVVWPRTRSLSIPSNTGQEIKNIFDLALERNLKTVGIVTIGVHIPRTGMYMAEWQSQIQKYRDLFVQLFASEKVLVATDLKSWPRVEALRKSQALLRNWEGPNRETAGIRRIILDEYGDAKPKIELK